MDSLARLTTSEIDTIKAHKAILLKAEHIVKVPWQMLAAVWYRERGLHMGNNPFQFDPPPSHAVILGLLQSYTDYKPTSYSVDDFPFAAILAACWLRHKCRYPLVMIESHQYDVGKDVHETKQVISIDSSAKAVADAFYGYNGRAYGDNPFNSPYVANEMDELHRNMHFRGEENGMWIDIIDKRPGAFVVYKQLVQEAV